MFDHDADIELAALNAAADHESALKRKGVCAHGWLQGLPGGAYDCKDCGAHFDSFEHADDARREVLDQ